METDACYTRLGTERYQTQNNREKDGQVIAKACPFIACICCNIIHNLRAVFFQDVAIIFDNYTKLCFPYNWILIGMS